MAEKPLPIPPANPVTAVPNETKPAGAESVAASRQSGHRSSDVRDALAEMAERAHLISQEAGTKIAAAMKDVITSAAGVAGFAVESARDLVQYMVRRGQMTQDEAEKLIRVAEEAQGRRGASARNSAKVASERSPAKVEAPQDAAKREAPPKGAASKRTPAAASAKADKKPAPKRTSAPKKTRDKPAGGKKRR
jgi:polyhydroxyalkanoate synthesis regulator phasin